MLRIAIDFDETLFPTVERVVETYNKKHNAQINMSQITKYNLCDCLSTDVSDELIKLFVDKSIYNSLFSSLTNSSIKEVAFSISSSV